MMNSVSPSGLYVLCLLVRDKETYILEGVGKLNRHEQRSNNIGHGQKETCRRQLKQPGHLQT
eukprot:scaffold25829_cov17-Prasinocladus_malaysianus.AAC.1